jgi:predicted Zn-dependent protease
LQRALRLDPRSFEARLASTAVAAEAGTDARATELTLRELHAERPTDQRVLRALGSTLSRQGRLEEASAFDDESAALPGGDPLALYNKAWNYWYAGQTRAARDAITASLAQKPFSSSLLADCYFHLVIDGDLDGAKRALDRVPPAAKTEDRGAVFAGLVYGWRREPDNVIASLRVVPRDWLDDNFYRGPRDLLAADALAEAGRMEAVSLNYAYLLAALGEKEKAAVVLRAWEQANGNGYSDKNPMPAIVRATYLRLGRKAEVIAHVRALFNGPNKRAIFYLTPAELRLAPAWDLFRQDPGFAELLAAAEAVERAGNDKK